MGDVIALPSYGLRLSRAAQYERDTREQHQAALRARNALIHEATDNRYPQKSIARDCGLSAPTITRILAQPLSDSPPGAA